MSINDDCRRAARHTHQFTRARAVRQPDRHHHRVLRFLYLRHRRSAGVPHTVLPAGDGSAAMLQSLATFAVAFVARPVGSAVFGHFGDRVGRKATLVAALLTMGLSTVAIGLLPSYAQIGVFAPALLALCRFGQGLGLGGEWGGAVLLATENAPPGKRVWYGMFPQLGAPLGFCCPLAPFWAWAQCWTMRSSCSGAGACRFGQCLARTDGAVGTPEHHRDARFPEDAGPQDACQAAAGHRGLAALAGTDRRHAGRVRHLRAVLSDDGLCTGLWHQDAGLRQGTIPVVADGRHRVLRWAFRCRPSLATGTARRWR